MGKEREEGRASSPRQRGAVARHNEALRSECGERTRRRRRRSGRGVAPMAVRRVGGRDRGEERQHGRRNCATGGKTAQRADWRRCTATAGKKIGVLACGPHQAAGAGASRARRGCVRATRAGHWDAALGAAGAEPLRAVRGRGRASASTQLGHWAA
jgi:hypothetical protein